jgi:hypothetical protein
MNPGSKSDRKGEDCKGDVVPSSAASRAPWISPRLRALTTSAAENTLSGLGADAERAFS